MCCSVLNEKTHIEDPPYLLHNLPLEAPRVIKQPTVGDALEAAQSLISVDDAGGAEPSD